MQTNCHNRLHKVVGKTTPHYLLKQRRFLKTIKHVSTLCFDMAQLPIIFKVVRRCTKGSTSHIHMQLQNPQFQLISGVQMIITLHRCWYYEDYLQMVTVLLITLSFPVSSLCSQNQNPVQAPHSLELCLIRPAYSPRLSSMPLDWLSLCQVRCATLGF